nr:hypothetical protein [Tanacetum cinerariifolium]
GVAAKSVQPADPVRLGNPARPGRPADRQSLGAADCQAVGTGHGPPLPDRRRHTRRSSGRRDADGRTHHRVRLPRTLGLAADERQRAGRRSGRHSATLQLDHCNWPGEPGRAQLRRRQVDRSG